MLQGVYEDFGCPTPGPDALAAVPYIQAVWGGGNLHIVIEDWNVEDECLDLCEQSPLKPEERACLDALRALSEEQRIAALAAAE